MYWGTWSMPHDIIGAAASGPVGPVLAGPIFREKVGVFIPVVGDCLLVLWSHAFSHAWLLVGVAAQRSSHAAIRYGSKAGGTGMARPAFAPPPSSEIRIG